MALYFYERQRSHHALPDHVVHEISNELLQMADDLMKFAKRSRRIEVYFRPEGYGPKRALHSLTRTEDGIIKIYISGNYTLPVSENGAMRRELRLSREQFVAFLWVIS